MTLPCGFEGQILNHFFNRPSAHRPSRLRSRCANMRVRLGRCLATNGGPRASTGGIGAAGICNGGGGASALVVEMI